MKTLAIWGIITTVISSIIGVCIYVASSRSSLPLSSESDSTISPIQPSTTQVSSPPPTTTYITTSIPTPTPTPTITLNVITINLSTDSSWKCLDADVKGWTSAQYDDSWWPDSWESEDIVPGLPAAKVIWYGEKPEPLIVYFRKSIDINGSEVISGRIRVKIQAYGEGVSTIPDMGRVYIYINNQYVDKLESGGYMNDWRREKEYDITSYFTTGKNVIAVCVEFTESGTEPPTISKYNWWGLSATIRYATPQ